MLSHVSFALVKANAITLCGEKIVGWRAHVMVDPLEFSERNECSRVFQALPEIQFLVEPFLKAFQINQNESELRWDLL